MHAQSYGHLRISFWTVRGKEQYTGKKKQGTCKSQTPVEIQTGNLLVHRKRQRAN